MRLLKTGPYQPGQERLELIEKYGDQIPEYAILSHTWGEDEVLYADIQNDTAHHRKAYPKLAESFAQARKDGFGYLWIDTCCIDKTSSSELSEAINSMYSWYQASKKCYAFLADVSDVDLKAFERQFRNSRWFTRGWCLQELLAPSDLEFFSCDWQPLGDRSALQRLISETTRIDVDYLTGYRSVHQASISTRMSWAATRQTTRKEDEAYCLMGLFSVNMPMLYGEGGPRAFIRLQEEIMSHSDDHTIFAWTDAQIQDAPRTTRGLLADRPQVFAQAGSIIPWDNVSEEAPFDMSNRGLSITLPLLHLKDDLYVAALECHQPYQDNKYLGIYLKKLSTGPNQYARVECHKLGVGALAGRGRPRRLFVRQAQANERESARTQFLQLRSVTVDLEHYAAIDMLYPAPTAAELLEAPGETSQSRTWVPRPYPTVFPVPKGTRKLAVAILLIRQSDGESFVLMLGSITDYQVGFFACESDRWVEGYSALQALFSAGVGPASELWKLECHHVQPGVQPHVLKGRKIHTVDVKLKMLPRRTAKEQAAEQFLDNLADSPVQRFGKMSSLFRRGRD
ncbi:hypothetical protein LTR53_005449 [Teratosphaeriaceae sp. CCFEE 6253]|nr:hypothetical protein LTR53_005449 [Teratosphaeriaceae sp. CCFEE 6253]